MMLKRYVLISILLFVICSDVETQTFGDNSTSTDTDTEG